VVEALCPLLAATNQVLDTFDGTYDSVPDPRSDCGG
jgi:hypothetical protein